MDVSSDTRLLDLTTSLGFKYCFNDSYLSFNKLSKYGSDLEGMTIFVTS